MRRLVRAPALPAAFVLALASCPVHAGDWDVSPRIGLKENYSSNIFLQPDDLARHDWVTEITPGINITGTGRRANLDLFYTGQGLIYARDSSFNDLNHRLQADANVELIEDLLFINIAANARQEIVDNRGRFSTGDNINPSADREDVFTLAINPSLRKRFGSFADALLRVGLGTVLNSGTTSQDSDIGNLNFRLDSGRRFQRLPWSLTFDHRTEDREDDTSAEFNKLELTGRYAINRKYGVVFGGGYEENTFLSNRQDPSSVIWRIGGTWTPNPRASAEAGFNQRFFGTVFYFNGRYKRRRWLFTASYDTDATTVNQQRLERRLVPMVDISGAPIVDPDTGELLVVPTDVPTNVDDVFVNKRFRASVRYAGRRTTATLNGYAYVREYQSSDDDDENDYGLTANVTRALSPLTDLRVNGTWQLVDLRGGGERKRWSVGAGLTRRLSSTLEARFDLRHYEQSGDNPSDAYDENRASIYLSKVF